MLWLSSNKGVEVFWFDWLKKQLRGGISLNPVLKRNLYGTRLEKEGRIEEAINLYEQNIANQIDSTHPYERLHSLYFERGEYTKAMRVGQAFLALSNEGKVK